MSARKTKQGSARKSLALREAENYSKVQAIILKEQGALIDNLHQQIAQIRQAQRYAMDGLRDTLAKAQSRVLMVMSSPVIKQFSVVRIPSKAEIVDLEHMAAAASEWITQAVSEARRHRPEATPTVNESMAALLSVDQTSVAKGICESAKRAAEKGVFGR